MGIRAFLLAGGALACVTAPAAAQDVDSEEIIVTGSYTLDERIDTATGLGLAPRETPQSVTVITPQRIIDQNLDTVADVIRNATGVSMSEIDDIRNTFSARGFEIKNTQIDGVPLAWSLAGDSAETVADVSIYERIEIVRGATGLLTGAGDPSASINLVRKHANSRDLTGYVSGSIGSWENRQIEADVARALNQSGSIRGRVVGHYETTENFIDLYEAEKYIAYGVIEADLTDATTVRAGASYQVTNPNAPAWGALPSFYSDGSFIEWDRSTSMSAPWSYWDTTNTNYFANLVHDFANGWRITADYNRIVNTADTEILYLYGPIDRATGEGLIVNPYKSDGESVLDSFDIQLRGDYALFGREHEFTVGAMTSQQTDEVVSFAALNGINGPAGPYEEWMNGATPYGGFATTPDPARDLETEQTGYFAATRINVSDALKVIAGARVASWEQTGVSYTVVQDYGADNVVIPYLGVLYDLTPNHRLYGSYTEIFLPQNVRDINGATLDPIIGGSYELGLKSAFFDDALQTSIAIFRIEQDGIGQLTGEEIPGTNPPEQAYRPAAGATSEGFEFEIVGQLTENWNISAGYTQFEVEDASGAKVNTDAPRQIFSLFTTYNFAGALDALTIGGGVNWRGESYTDSMNTVTFEPFRFQQDAYALASIMARYDLTQQVSLQANVDNLFDETYYVQTGFYGQYRYGAPRNYSVALTYRF